MDYLKVGPTAFWLLKSYLHSTPLHATPRQCLQEDSCCGSQDHPTAFADYAEMRDALNRTGRDV